MSLLGHSFVLSDLYFVILSIVKFCEMAYNYIQVSYDISNEESLIIEVAPLQSIKDSYSKIIIARTKSDNYDYNGIVITDIARWLLE